MHTARMPIALYFRMVWQALPAYIALVPLMLGLALPPRAQATAIATSTLTFSGLSIVPMTGSVTLLDAWTLDAFAEAHNSLGEAMSMSPSMPGPGTAPADAVGTYADGHGKASAPNTPPDLMVTGSASSNVNLLGCNGSEAFATGRGTLSNMFKITGGTGDVTVQIGADITGSLHVLTDACGLKADTEVIFHLDVDGDPQLFYNTLFSIGPSDEMLLAVSQSLSNTLTLTFDTPYLLIAQVDSESHGLLNTPEPSTLVLLLSGCLGLLLTAWVRHRRVRTLVPRAVLTRLGMPLMLALALLLAAAPVQAKYIGGEPPSSCCKCKTGRPCTYVPGGSAISLTEGNLQEQYTLPSITSATGPTISFALAYNSYNADGSHAQVDTVLGYGWTHSYNIFLFTQIGHIFRMDGDGRVTKYKLGSGGKFTAAIGYFETLVKNPDGTFTLTQKDKTVFQFAQVPNTPFLVGGPVYRLTRITDRNNNTTTLSYTNGDLTSITDTYGRSLTLSYTSQHKLATVTDPLGRTTTFTYDATGRQLRTLTDPAGKTTQYTYDVSYHITKKIDKDGRMFSYSYDTRGNPVAIADGANNRLFSLTNTQNWATDSTALARDLLRVYVPATTSKTDGRGHVWQYTYDSHGYLTKIVAPDGATTTYTYDPSTLMVASVTDANGHTTSFQYDAQGNLIEKTDALGHVTTYTYEPVFNMMTSMTDANGRTTTYQIDPAKGNRLKETDPLGAMRTWTHDANGNVLTAQDKNGNITTYQYDAFGDRIQMTDAVGNVTTMAYDTVANLISRTDANHHTTTYQYDGLNRLIKETDPAGKITQTFYDGQGNRVKVIDRNNNATTYAYDLRQRLITTTDALSQPTTQSYDGNNNRTTFTDKNGHTTSFQYDVQNRLVKTTDALGNIMSMTYDGVGNKLTETDANTHTTTYQYDALDRMITKTDAIGCVMTMAYDSVGTAVCPQCTGPTKGSSLVTQQVDGDGKVTYFTYDGLDRLVKQIRKEGDTAFAIDPSDAVTSYTYDPQGNRLTMTEPNGNTTSYVYDALNRQTKVTNAAGDMTVTTYDPVSNAKTVTVPTLNVTTYTYDALDRVIQVDDSVGRVANYTYDAVGNRLTEQDGNGNGTTTTYDAIYRVTAVTDALGRTTHYAYDSVGNLVQLTDREGNVTTYLYDVINRRIRMTDALGHITQYQYDGVGNLTRIIDANNHATDYAYDPINRRIKETYADGRMRTFTYDCVSNLLTRTDQKGQVTNYVYNDLYFLLKRDYPVSPDDTMTYDLSGRMLTAERGGWLVTFTYDGANRVTQTTQNGKTISYIYNIPGRMRTLTYPGGQTITENTDARRRLDTIDDVASPPIVVYTYDLGNRVVSRTYRNGTTAIYTYNTNNWTLTLDHTIGVTRIAGFDYDFDREGNKLFEQKLHDPGDSETYGYDTIYRLIDFKVGTLVGSTVPVPTTQTQYDLDGVGNWKTKTQDSVPENRMHSVTNEITKIDAVPVLSDLNGNTSEDGPYRYDYDEENRLIAVTRTSDSRVMGQYQYDALSRRIAKMADPATPSSPTETRYFYDDACIIEEQSTGGTTHATYVYGNYIDEVLTMDRAGQTFYYHQNSLWSVEAITDASANVVERYTYDAYGLLTILDSASNPVPQNLWGTPHSAIGNPWLFTGRQLDEETGLYFYRARYYDPIKGRFLQRDPLGYVDGANLYQYSRSNPPNFNDPLGLVSECCVGIGDVLSQAVKLTATLAGIPLGNDVLDAIRAAGNGVLSACISLQEIKNVTCNKQKDKCCCQFADKATSFVQGPKSGKFGVIVGDQKSPILSVTGEGKISSDFGLQSYSKTTCPEVCEDEVREYRLQMNVEGDFNATVTVPQLKLPVTVNAGAQAGSPKKTCKFTCGQPTTTTVGIGT